jgi:hypothetical protein
MSALLQRVAFALALAATASFIPLQAQPLVSTRWGLLLGGNFNMAGIGWAQWVSDPKRPGGQFGSKIYNDGQGGGFYGGLTFQTSITDAIHFGTPMITGVCWQLMSRIERVTGLPRPRQPRTITTITSST